MPKSKYETHVQPYLNTIQSLARKGLTEEQIAAKLGITRQTFYGYKTKYPDLLDVLKPSKDEVDAEVENALLKNALGFIYEEEVLTPAGQVVTVNRYAKPNTTAQIFWLKNRMPQDWRDKQEIEHSGEVSQKDEHHYHITEEIVESNPNLVSRIFGRSVADRSSES